MDDLISRQDAIDAIVAWTVEDRPDVEMPTDLIERITGLPSAQPTLYGYDIEHLMRIAVVLRQENLPPEKVAEALADIGRIVSIVRNEFEESLRKAVEQCMI